jgi:hypothetical protein
MRRGGKGKHMNLISCMLVSITILLLVPLPIMMFCPLVQHNMLASHLSLDLNVLAMMGTCLDMLFSKGVVQVRRNMQFFVTMIVLECSMCLTCPPRISH